jgi:hypothetical protein
MSHTIGVADTLWIIEEKGIDPDCYSSIINQARSTRTPMGLKSF